MWELIVTAIGVASDAFAVSICKGLSVSRVKFIHMLTAGVYFGAFQALMPCFGYLLGERFKFAIESVDHWVAFFLLFFIGIGMFLESFQEENLSDASFSPATMLPLALSTSIDAMAVGVTFSIENVDMRLATIVIGVITAILSGIGVKLGGMFGIKYKTTAERLGSGILIFMGFKILTEHLFLS